MQLMQRSWEAGKEGQQLGVESTMHTPGPPAPPAASSSQCWWCWATGRCPVGRDRVRRDPTGRPVLWDEFGPGAGSTASGRSCPFSNHPIVLQKLIFFLNHSRLLLAGSNNSDGIRNRNQEWLCGREAPGESGEFGILYLNMTGTKVTLKEKTLAFSPHRTSLCEILPHTNSLSSCPDASCIPYRSVLTWF